MHLYLCGGREQLSGGIHLQASDTDGRGVDVGGSGRRGRVKGKGGAEEQPRRRAVRPRIEA